MYSKDIILSYYKRHWPRYLIGIIIIIFSTYLSTVLPNYLGIAIDALNSENIDLDKVRNISITFGVIAILVFITRFIWRYLLLGFCRKIEFYLREKLFEHLQKLSASFYVENNTGDMITRAISDVQAVRMMLGFATFAIIDAIITTTMSIINMSTTTNSLLTILVIIPIPFLLFIIVKVRLMVRKRYTKVQEAVSDISSKVQENITGIRVIKAFSQEEEESKAFTKLSNKKVDAEIKLAYAFAIINPSVQLTFGIIFAIFLVLGGALVSDTKITIGDFVAFNSYLILIMGPISNIGRIVERWQRGIASMKRLDGILLSKPSIDDQKSDESIVEIKAGEIDAVNLNFGYDPNNLVIDNLSFHVPSGGKIAIMGPTGCGKTTIIDLLMRVWLCSDKMLFIDGQDINNIPLKVLRKSCVYVPQESFLFSDTIMENIRFYDKSITDEEVIQAAISADVHENILEFPKGYNQVVGERGMTLSGGQKQRIALARALVRKPKILILDDCMSAVDSSTEKRIIENLRNSILNCTTLIVTHRLSAAQLADEILLLNPNGTLGEIGDHDTLIKNQGSYAKLVQLVQSEDSLFWKDGDNNGEKD